VLESELLRKDKLPARVLFYGVTGSGKSSAAHRYAEIMSLPEYSADDDIGWLPGWTVRALDDERTIAATIAAQDRWVLDSAYAKWSDLILPRTQLIVALDYPRLISLSRLVRRTARRVVTKETICKGNTETAFKHLFTADSIILWHFKSFSRKHRTIHRLHADPDRPPVKIFRHPRHLAAWFAELEGARQNAAGGPPAR
jgi:adenylate kinase family enzyme